VYKSREKVERETPGHNDFMIGDFEEREPYLLALLSLVIGDGSSKTTFGS